MKNLRSYSLFCLVISIFQIAVVYSGRRREFGFRKSLSFNFQTEEWTQRSLADFRECFPQHSEGFLDFAYKCITTDGKLDSGERFFLKLFEINPVAVDLNLDCFYVIRTNTFFSSPCTLPPGCGKPIFKQLSHTWWGQELGFCYSLYPVEKEVDDRIEVYSFPNDMDLCHGDIATNYNPDDYVNVQDLSPSYLYDFLYLLYYPKTKLWNIIPKVCIWSYEHYGPNGVLYSPDVSAFRIGDDVCYQMPNFDNLDVCYNLLAEAGGLGWPDRLHTLIERLNPYFYASHLPARCRASKIRPYNESDYHVIQVNSTGVYTVYADPYNRTDFLSSDATQKPPDFGNFSIRTCKHISEQYRDPFTTAVDSTIETVLFTISDTFYVLVRKFESELSSILSYFWRLFVVAFKYVISKLPLGLLIYFISVLTVTLLVFRDFLISVYFTILFLFLRVLILS